MTNLAPGVQTAAFPYLTVDRHKVCRTASNRAPTNKFNDVDKTFGIQIKGLSHRLRAPTHSKVRPVQKLAEVTNQTLKRVDDILSQSDI